MSFPDDPKVSPTEEFVSLLFVIVPFTMSPFTIEFARFNFPYAMDAPPDMSAFTIVPSVIFDDVIVLVPIVNNPDEFTAKSPEAVTKAGTPDPFATKN